MKGSTLQTQVVPALLSGAARQSLAMVEFTPLQLLSLAGQALRFARPATPSAFSAEPEIRDPRRILPEHLRRPLVRLLSDRKASAPATRAVAQAFDSLGLRPHPFDFPAMELFLGSFAERLGPTAEYWVERQQRAAEPGSYFADEVLDDANWAQARPARRVAYFEARRCTNPDEARALLESVWPQQNADVRFRLLEALQTGLAAEDQPLLASLEKDRSPRVRSLAARLLARFGVSGNNPALQACLERIHKTKSGILRERAVLRLDVPAQLKGEAIPPWVREIFGDVSFAELTRALEFEERELIEAAAMQEELLLGFALMATAECRLDLLAQIVAYLPATGVKLFESRLESLGRMSPEDRGRWAETIAEPYKRSLPDNYFFWDWLHSLLGRPVPASILTAVFETDLLARIQGVETAGGAWLELMAALCPPSLRDPLKEHVAAYDPALSGQALMLLEILDGMEKTENNG
ncbi:MAG: DUF5691 domain-containing protein [Acidobacteriota bacterium]